MRHRGVSFSTAARRSSKSRAARKHSRALSRPRSHQAKKERERKKGFFLSFDQTLGRRHRRRWGELFADFAFRETATTSGMTRSEVRKSDVTRGVTYGKKHNGVRWLG